MRNPFNKKSPVEPPPAPPADDAPPVAPVEAVAESAPMPAPTFSDEGVRYEAIDTTTIVNLAADAYDAHRRELHIQGRSFAHVSEAAGGAWIYRHDT